MLDLLVACVQLNKPHRGQQLAMVLCCCLPSLLRTHHCHVWQFLLRVSAVLLLQATALTRYRMVRSSYYTSTVFFACLVHCQGESMFASQTVLDILITSFKRACI